MTWYNIILLQFTMILLDRASTETEEFVNCKIPSATTELGYHNSAGSVVSLPAELTEIQPYIWVTCLTPGYTWTSDIRYLSYVDPEIIDAKTGSSSNNSIKITCSDGVLSPTLLTDKSTWCSAGCPLLPTGIHSMWQANYPTPAMANVSSVAPILQSNENIALSCRDGAAPMNGGPTLTETRCTSTGYSPNLNSLINCVSGCRDPAKLSSAVRISGKPSAVVGEAPYNIGDVITLSCKDPGLVLSTPSQLTCLSVQRWNSDEVPKCEEVSAFSKERRSCVVQHFLVFITTITMYFCISSAVTGIRQHRT